MKSVKINKNNMITYSAGNKRYLFLTESGLILEMNRRIQDYFLRGRDDEEIEHILEEANKKEEEKYRVKRIKLTHLTIIVTDHCNLDCSYCYVKKKNSKHLDLATLKKTISHFLNCYELDDQLNITFFGGEPLLNYECIKKVCSYIRQIAETRKLNINYSITTNGTILNDDIFRLFCEYDFNIIISIDGNEDMQVANRFKNYKMYKTLLKNVCELSKYFNLNARMTICDNNIDLLAEIKHLFSIGFNTISFEPVSNFIYDTEHLKYEYLISNLSEVGDYYLNNLKHKEFKNLTKYTNTLKKIHFGHSSEHFCNAGNSAFAVDLFGNINVCHRFINNDKYIVGDTAKGISNYKRRKFLNRHLLNYRDNGRCNSCWARFLCGGSCIHSAHTAKMDSTNISDLNCCFQKTIIEKSLKIYSSLTPDEKVLLDNI